MSTTITVRNSMIGGGVTVQDNRSITADNVIVASETLPVGQAGTAGADGVMTLGTHAFTDASVVAVTWATGCRYGCACSAYDATTLTVNGATGAGDALPTSGAVVVGLQTEIDLAFVATNMVALSVGCDQTAKVTLNDAGGIELAVDVAANGAYAWDSGNGVTNPITGDSIITAECYPKSVTAGTIQILVAYDNA